MDRKEDFALQSLGHNLMEGNKPVVKQLRSSEDRFLETAGVETDPLFQTASVASANDCTGIAVTPPFDPTEAESLDALKNSPIPTADKKERK